MIIEKRKDEQILNLVPSYWVLMLIYRFYTLILNLFNGKVKQNCNRKLKFKWYINLG